MFQKLKSIYTKNKILGITSYLLAFIAIFYILPFFVGSYLIKFFWKIEMPNWLKVGVLIVPLFFIGIVGYAWTGVTTGIIKPPPKTETSQSSISISSIRSSSVASSSVISSFSSQADNKCRWWQKLLRNCETDPNSDSSQSSSNLSSTSSQSQTNKECSWWEKLIRRCENVTSSISTQTSSQAISVSQVIVQSSVVATRSAINIISSVITIPQTPPVQEYIKLEPQKAPDATTEKIEVVNDLQEVEKAINTVPVGEFVKVLEVVDGDTIKVEKFGTLRLIGIDTPETKDPRKVVQCFGKEATQNAKNKLSGQKVKLEFNPADRIDKYNRLLAYITTESGYDYNYNAILDGYANAYVKFPHPRLDGYVRAQTLAREAKRGLWSDSTCNGNTTQPSAENTKTNVQIPPIIPPVVVTPKTPQVIENKPQIIEALPKPAKEERGEVLLVTSSQLCHTKASKSYTTIKYYTSFNSVDECVKAGGKLYK